MTLRNTLVVGLANEQHGNALADELQHLTGGTNALTIGATNVRVGVTGGSLGVLGAAPVVRQQCTTNTVTALHACLANFGLVSSTIG